MRLFVVLSLACGTAADLTSTGMLADDRCPLADSSTASDCAQSNAALSKEDYYQKLKSLNIKELYNSIVDLLTTSQDCWPADGPQDGDVPNYAGLFGRLAWHCSGTFRLIDGTNAAGGCEGGRQRFWPENEWRDNVNLDKARALLAPIKDKFGDQISWGDLMTFAGTVGIKASGGPAKKFCFGRVDDNDGSRSIKLGVEGVNSCSNAKSDAPCKNTFQWPQQDEADHSMCNITQDGGRLQASHSVGLIYVFPEGPQLKSSDAAYNSSWVHNRSPKLSALGVRDTFKKRMGWTDRETVALVGGGHTLGRTHGNCNLAGTQWESFPERGPFFEATPMSGRGPTDGTCGTGPLAGASPNTVSSGFEGPWTRTPSRWNYDYFEAMFSDTWEPSRSESGNDQWWTTDRNSTYANTMRLTSDLALVEDDTYREIATAYRRNHELFDSEFEAAWYKLVHRSEDHPHEDDLEKDAGICTQFEFLNMLSGARGRSPIGELLLFAFLGMTLRFA
jgi:catalase (peroxidase I)